MITSLEGVSYPDRWRRLSESSLVRSLLLLGKSNGSSLPLLPSLLGASRVSSWSVRTRLCPVESLDGDLRRFLSSPLRSGEESLELSELLDSEEDEGGCRERAEGREKTVSINRIPGKKRLCVT